MNMTAAWPPYGPWRLFRISEGKNATQQQNKRKDTEFQVMYTTYTCQILLALTLHSIFDLISLVLDLHSL